MTLRLSTAARNTKVAALTSLVDAGSGAGKLRIYTGGQPSGGPADAATGTLLVEIALNDPAFDAPSNGSAAADVSPTPTGTASNTGTAGWARLLDSNNTAILDGSVTASGGGGDFIINATAVTSGSAVNLLSCTYTQPSS